MLALTSDKAHAVQINMRDHCDLSLARATLEFALRHERAVLGTSTAVIVPGFQAKDSMFNAVASVAPPIHEAHKVKHPKLHDVTYRVYPAFVCEFSGRETALEARLRNAKMIDPADLRREAVPVVRIRYVNSITKGRTIGNQRGLDNPSVLYAELGKLDHAPDSFVEFENYLGEVRKVTWDDGFIWWEGNRTRRMEHREVLDRAKRFVLHGEESDAA